MASGKKNYFRHSFFAFEDEKIQKAIDKLGFEGYAYYFIILELLARKCEHEIKNPIRIHQQTLRTVLRKQSKSCNKVITKLQESGLFVATFEENFVEFDVPNLAKYLGKYTNKKSPNSPNKRKEKEIKEKKSKVNKTITEKHEINAEFKKSGPLTDEAIYILERVKPEHQKTWVEKYDPVYISEVLFDAFNYYKENLTGPKFEKKIWVSSINGWIKRDKNPVFRKTTQEELENKFGWLKS